MNKNVAKTDDITVTRYFIGNFRANGIKPCNCLSYYLEFSFDGGAKWPVIFVVFNGFVFCKIKQKFTAVYNII